MMAAEQRAAVLPGALQRPEAPAEPLARQPLQRVRGLGIGDRVIGVGDAPTARQQRQRQVLVLCHGLVAEAARVQHQLATPCPHGSRHHRDAVQERKGAAVEILARHVLDGLPPRHEVDAVPHLGVARHRPHARVGERRHQRLNRPGGEQRVGIHGHDDLARRLRDPEVQGARLAAVRLADQAHTGIAAECRRHHLGGAVR